MSICIQYISKPQFGVFYNINEPVIIQFPICIKKIANITSKSDGTQFLNNEILCIFELSEFFFISFCWHFIFSVE